MEKPLFLAAWAVVCLVLVLRAARVGPRAMLKALGRGAMWAEPRWALPLPAADRLLLWLGHAGGLAYLWRLGGQSYRLAIPLGLLSAALLLLPQWPSLLRRQAPDVTPLTVLWVPYLAGLLYGLGLLPPPAGHTLLWGAELGAGAYAVLVQVQRRWAGPGRPAAALLLLAATGGWVLLQYLGRRTQGVTGSDPYCYAQMAVDMARHGDPRHAFSLFPLVRGLGIPWWPLVHVGYYPPSGGGGLAATVWPVGWPALLAVAYRLLGESGLYVGAPLAGLLALGATAVLLREVWPRGPSGARWLGIALAVPILATSREQVLQVLVPMADVPAQLFSLLAVWLALRAGKRGSWAQAAGAGLALGLAYDIRHTQVFLAPVLALALGRAGGWRRWGPLLLAAGVGACLAAAPDLWYHQVAFGSPWRPESPELNLIGLRYWGANAQRMAAALASWHEFGLLLPLLAYGAWRLWRGERHGAGVLLAWIVVNGGTQLLYSPLRWRDLLAIVPALAILTAYGATDLIQRVRAHQRLGDWAPGWAALGLAVILALRVIPIVAWPLLTAEMNFGYLTGEQRQAFQRLGESVEVEAVIGSSLNSGPIELYTGRQTFRPGDWSGPELEVFMGAMAAAGKPVYIVDDGNEHASTVARLQGEGRLEAVCVLGVPLYGDRERLSGILYRVRH